MICNKGSKQNQKHQTQQMENKNEVSQTSQQNEAVPSERFYKDTLIPQKKTKVVFQGELVRGF